MIRYFFIIGILFFALNANAYIPLPFGDINGDHWVDEKDIDLVAHFIEHKNNPKEVPPIEYPLPGIGAFNEKDFIHRCDFDGNKACDIKDYEVIEKIVEILKRLEKKDGSF